MTLIDLRSDTVTRPSPEMRKAMNEAEVGDDTFGEDPTVNALQELAAEIFCKEAALFVPSGTMANQICIRVHTEPGDEIIVADNSHIFLYEGGAHSALSGVSARCVPTKRGVMAPEDVQAAVRHPKNRSHYPVTKLISIENTCNRGGGTIYPFERIHEIAAIAFEHKLKYHLDGARLFNASVAVDMNGAELAAPFDTVSCCLSKGLGAPVGSLILGTEADIERAHRFRKMFGGGMRQAGILAAAGIYALEHNVDRLIKDNQLACYLAEGLMGIEELDVAFDDVQTNIMYFKVRAEGKDASWFIDAMKQKGVLLATVDRGIIRAVTHLDVNEEAADKAIEAAKAVFAGG